MNNVLLLVGTLCALYLLSWIMFNMRPNWFTAPTVGILGAMLVVLLFYSLIRLFSQF